MIEVYNLQRKVSIETEALRRFADRLASLVTEARGHTFSIAMVSDRRIRELNNLFRRKDTATDVLSFPQKAEPFEPDTLNLGDIVVSLETAQRQATENDLDLLRETKQLILHGLLHLCGYDHERDNGEMNERELELRKKLKI